MKLENYLSQWKLFLENEGDGHEIGMQTERGEIYRDLVWSHRENALQKMFPRLENFHHFNWHEVSREYYKAYPAYAYDLNRLTLDFPEFLKSHFPDHLSEIAEYELAEFLVYTSVASPAKGLGLQLNPTAHFLKLEYDISEMVKRAEKGIIETIVRPNLLCISRHADQLLRFTELSQDALNIIVAIENHEFIGKKESEIFRMLIKQGIIIEC